MKAYETLLEVDATGSEFNLACILIGLERDPKQVPWQNLSQAERLVGRRIAISIAWSEGWQASAGTGRGSAAESGSPT